MRTDLVYFDSLDESRKGTVRALVAILVLIAFDLYYYGETIETQVFPLLVTWLMVGSALGVMLPRTLEESAVLGFLIGSVVYGTLAMYIHNDFWDRLKFYLFSVIKVTLASVAIFKTR